VILPVGNRIWYLDCPCLGTESGILTVEVIGSEIRLSGSVRSNLVYFEARLGPGPLSRFSGCY